MKAREQVHQVLMRAAEVALPITALEVEPAFYAALEDECEAMLLLKPPVYFEGVRQPPAPREGMQVLTFNGPLGSVRITERPE